MAYGATCLRPKVFGKTGETSAENIKENQMQTQTLGIGRMHLDVVPLDEPSNATPHAEVLEAWKQATIQHEELAVQYADVEKQLEPAANAVKNAEELVSKQQADCDAAEAAIKAAEEAFASAKSGLNGAKDFAVHARQTLDGLRNKKEEIGGKIDTSTVRLFNMNSEISAMMRALIDQNQLSRNYGVLQQVASLLLESLPKTEQEQEVIQT